MKIYKVKDEYITYLRKHEPKVLENKGEKRPYIGVVLKVNNFNYYVPLSSPKPKHQTMKNAKDFHKINNGIYGAINFNKIIPVKDCCIISFKFTDEENEEYRLLLQNQYKFIKEMEELIHKKSNEIYRLFREEEFKLTNADLRIKDRCCNFDLLEKLCNEYNA